MVTATMASVIWPELNGAADGLVLVPANQQQCVVIAGTTKTPSPQELQHQKAHNTITDAFECVYDKSFSDVTGGGKSELDFVGKNYWWNQQGMEIVEVEVETEGREGVAMEEE